MYQYSLQWFRNLFIQAIRLSEPSTELNTRIKSLNDFFTYYVYTNICRSLFERHKLLFAFLLTVRKLQGDDEIDPQEWMFLVSGKGPASNASANPAGDWIDGRMWSEMSSLSSLDKFAGFSESVKKSPELFRDIYDSLEPQATKLPCGWHQKLNSFQKLCVLRSIRADKVPDGVMAYVIEKLGQQFVEPPPFDLLACYKDSNVLSPWSSSSQRARIPPRRSWSSPPR